MPILVLASFTGAAGHAEVLWHSIPRESSLAFTARWESNPVPGHFNNFQVRLAMVRGFPRSLNVTIDIPSLQFRSPLIAHAARSRVWFDMQRFKRAQFSSIRFQKTGPQGEYQAFGTLQLKGIRRPVSIQFHLNPIGSKQLELTGETSVTRTEFAIGTGPWRTSTVIGRQVVIRFQVRLAQNP